MAVFTIPNVNHITKRFSLIAEAVVDPIVEPPQIFKAISEKENAMQRSARRLALLALVALPANLAAQSPRMKPAPKPPAPARSEDQGWRSKIYLIGSTGPVWTQFKVSGANAAVQQASNINVPGRGIVVVPGTSIPFLPVTTDWKDWDGFTGSIGLGYQIRSGKREWDAEGDVNAGSGDASIVQAVMMPATALQSGGPAFMGLEFRNKWGVSLRGRVAQPWRSALAYVTAGWTGQHVTATAHDSTNIPVAPELAVKIPAVVTPPWSATHEDSHLHSGFTLGFGLQRSYSPRADFALEYKYAFFGSQTYAFPFSEAELIAINLSRTIVEPPATAVKLTSGQLTARVILKQPWW